MLVDRDSFESVLDDLRSKQWICCDTETTGLRPYHGDRLFSIILAADDSLAYYFNFQVYEGMDPKHVLLPEHLERLRDLFQDPTKTWYFHNAKFDLAMLANEKIEVAGTVHCTQAVALLEYNEHLRYRLEDCAKRIGLEKSDAVEKYIQENDLWEWETIPGKKQRKKNKFFFKVPAPVIIPYGEQDGRVGYCLGRHQEAAIRKLDEEQPPHLPQISQVLENERRLTKTVFKMERLGVKIDRPYCVRASRYEGDRSAKAIQDFQRETKRDFKSSNKLFQEIFQSEKNKWVWGERTKTGQINPSFESEVLKRFENPAAKAILEYRDAKSKYDFYQGFLYHADQDDVVHPTFSQDGAPHGRFSSSNPNFQNLTSEEEEDDLKQEFLIRRAIVPRPGFIFVMPDWDQMEYRLMFDTACDLIGQESAIVKEIKQGKDPHQATADVVTAGGTPLTRKRAKNGNFAYLYGSGYDTLAATIGSTREEAIALKHSLRKAAPEVDHYVRTITQVAKMRGYIFNWFGRRCYFPDSNFAYKAPNYHISGGCADIAKISMNRIEERFSSMKSRMVLTIHDEFPMEIHESEIAMAPSIAKEIMETVYPWRYLPLTVGVEWSDKSLGDKRKGFPV